MKDIDVSPTVVIGGLAFVACLLIWASEGGEKRISCIKMRQLMSIWMVHIWMIFHKK